MNASEATPRGRPQLLKSYRRITLLSLSLSLALLYYTASHSLAVIEFIVWIQILKILSIYEDCGRCISFC